MKTCQWMMRKAGFKYEECGDKAVVVLNGTNVAYCEKHAKEYCESEGIVISNEPIDKPEQPAPG